MEKDIYFEAYVDGIGVSLYVTRKGYIMPEMTAEPYVTAGEIEKLVTAKGFNCCFQTSDKREFARDCHFNNILLRKIVFINDNYDGVIEEHYLSELRKSPAKLRKFLSI